MKPAQITVIRDGLLTSHRLTADITETVPTAQRLVKEHFGRRPLTAVEVVVTSTNRIAMLATMAQGAAAGLKPEAWERKSLTLTSRPHDLYSVAVIAPNNTVRVLVNATRLRRRQREIGATLVWAFVEVDQLCRKGAWDHRIALTRHELGANVLPKHKARALYRIEVAWEAEAAKATEKIIGTVIRQNHQAEAAADREAQQTAPAPS
ncbi:hypothetical protein GCM10010300_77200 [Streptomyces olivaceoviridis]|uniref:hypothetical protein n=1 Tax=Streptomyces olivaceoviridis TaxID=1921 RepID=UPI00167BDC98|nr:hypothetical protein [Streptomyces olivaceoviridis]GGZ22030.1 hypothetical protein GCM10010300_77200 [Streptomyces olivaceoviridis]